MEEGMYMKNVASVISSAHRTHVSTMSKNFRHPISISMRSVPGELVHLVGPFFFGTFGESDSRKKVYNPITKISYVKHVLLLAFISCSRMIYDIDDGVVMIIFTHL